MNSHYTGDYWHIDALTRINDDLISHRWVIHVAKSDLTMAVILTIDQAAELAELIERALDDVAIQGGE